MKNDFIDAINNEFTIKKPLIFTNTVVHIPDNSSEMSKTAIKPSITPDDSLEIIYNVPSIIDAMTTNRTSYLDTVGHSTNGDQIYEHDLFSCQRCKRMKSARKKCAKRKKIKKPIIDTFDYRLF